MKGFGLVFCFLCVNLLEASETYRAGVLRLDKRIPCGKDCVPFVNDAKHSNVDVLVLPSDEQGRISDEYEDTVKALSNAAKDAGLYVVAPLYEHVRCQKSIEVVKSHLVFDREGAIVSDYRKPVSNLANCTSTSSDLVTFTTDFGVTLGLLVEEDIVLHDEVYMKGLKNFVMIGANYDGTFLNAAEFSSPWSFVNNVNLISNSGVYNGKGGFKDGLGRLAVIDLNKNGGSENTAVPTISPSAKFPGEDLSQYVIKPLDLEATIQGHHDTVCHRSFCCEFYVKTGVAGPESGMSYSLAAFEGDQRFAYRHSIGAQICAVIACSDSSQSQCESSSNIQFEKISIAANFTKQNVQYPIVQSTSVLPAEKFRFNTKNNDISTQVTLEIVDSRNIVGFGIFGRDFSKDIESFAAKRNSTESSDIYDDIIEDVQEFFDYVWIRLRILLVVVSIYVLEMM